MVHIIFHSSQLVAHFTSQGRQHIKQPYMKIFYKKKKISSNSSVISVFQSYKIETELSKSIEYQRNIKLSLMNLNHVVNDLV